MKSLESVHMVLFGSRDSEPVRVDLPAVEPPALTPLAADLQKIMQLVNNGLWCRNTTNDGQGHSCIWGLALRVTGRGYFEGSYWNRYEQIMEVLYDAIPPDRLAEYKRLCDTNQTVSSYRRVNDGYPRGYSDVTAVVTGYNNTRNDEAEVIEWIQDAQILAMRKGI